MDGGVGESFLSAEDPFTPATRERSASTCGQTLQDPGRNSQILSNVLRWPLHEGLWMGVGYSAQVGLVEGEARRRGGRRKQ
jgi:hypothetical protein